MTEFDPHTQVADCPFCGSHNVLLVTATATVASLYCLSCEHLFAAEIVPGTDPEHDQQPIPRPPSARVGHQLRCLPGP